MASSLLRDAISRTPWLDTHEHLLEERHRLDPNGYSFWEVLSDVQVRIPPDWTSLLVDLHIEDLVSAGMPARAVDELTFDDLDPVEKWLKVEPYFLAARSTGYLRAVDLTTEALFGSRLSRETVLEVDAGCRALRREGYYEHVLHGVANVSRCHVNSVEEEPFCVSASPEILQQDIALLKLVTGHHPRVERLSDIEVGRLDDYLEVLEWCFATYAPSAVAVKSQWAYYRPLVVSPVDAPPRRAFQKLRRGEADLSERRQVEDYLFARCIELATEHQLPVKIHLGSLAGNRRTQLSAVSQHVRDVTPLVQAFPRTRFVLFHMAWPHQEQLIALAKHAPNVVVDLCWAWLVAPVAARDFVVRFLTSVPATKLFGFGADYMVIETVVGHAELARRGLQGALEDLISCEWLTPDQALELVPLLMHENAEHVYSKEVVPFSTAVEPSAAQR